MRNVLVLSLGAVLISGCSFEPAYQVTCADEGAREGARVCTDGVWVTENPAPDMMAGGDVTLPVDAGMDGSTPCTAETDEQFCARLGLTCDEVTDTDNCGDARTANCGTCSGQATCGGGGTPNVCACAAQSDDDFCASNGKTCDPYTDVDACGEMRTVNCGMCDGVATCAADNACTCDVAAACGALNANCGMLDTTDMCAGTNSITCGSCDDPNASCDPDNRCACAAGYAGDGLTCTEIDECADMTDDCDANATCANTPGSFTCTCNTGYSGDGKTCVRIPQPVDSVQDVTLSMNDGESSGTAAIAPVVQAQAVPFATMRLTDTDGQGNRVAVDVYLSANNELTISRDNGNGAVDVSAYIVEFDPTDAVVQSGTFSFGGNTDSVMLPAAVDPAKSFVVFYYERDNGEDNKEDLLVAGDLNGAGDAIDFVREDVAGTISGHWWVVESVANAFDVQHLTGSMNGQSTNIAAASVTTAKSFLLYSYASDHNNNDADRAQAWCNLASSTNVQCRRSSDQDAVTNIRVQVVALTGNEAVQRGTEQISGGISSASVNLPRAAGANAMPFGGQLGAPGMTFHSTTSGTQTPGGYFLHELSGGGSTLDLRRGSPRDAASAVVWQLIDW